MKIAIVGATGIVGRKTLEVLQQKNIKAKYILFASKNSKGKKIDFFGKQYKINQLCEKQIVQNPVDYVLFCTSASVSKQYVHKFIKNGATVIDFSSEYRKTKAPLVVPEINIQKAKGKKLVCNPNCSSIGAVVFLHQIHKKYGLEKLVISTYQAVSGAGKNALDDLHSNAETLKKFDYPIKDNLLCYIGELNDKKYSTEEQKMRYEIRKILQDKSIKISATCVRVPITVCHGETIWFKTKSNCTTKQIYAALKQSAGVKIIDDYPHFPMPIECRGQDDVFVGRVRKDQDDKNCFFAYIVSDNLRKGASANAVQILEYLIKNGENYGNI